MNKGIIFLFIFILIFIGVLAFVYFKYEYPFRNLSYNYYNLTIETFNKERIKTGYVIEVDGIFFKEGETIRQSPTFVRIPKNSSILVYNKNLLNQNFYTSESSFVSSEEINYRVRLNLEEAINITANYKLENNKILLNFSENAKKLCLRWSSRIINVESNLTNFNKPNSYKNYDKCFNLEKNATLSYRTFGEISENDFVELIFIDVDERKGIELTEFNEKDLGSEDKKLIVRFK